MCEMVEKNSSHQSGEKTSALAGVEKEIIVVSFTLGEAGVSGSPKLRGLMIMTVRGLTGLNSQILASDLRPRSCASTFAERMN